MSAADDGAVLVRRDGAVATIVLNRPDALNALNDDLGIGLRDAVLAVAEDPEVRAVVLTGAGRAFCAGADLKGKRTVTAEGYPDLGRRIRERYVPLILALREMPKPVIAAVNGPAIGMGCSIAVACDLIVLAQSAFLQLSFAKLGLGPDGGVSQLLPERIGYARASEMLLLGERVDADMALRWGLANRVHPDGELTEKVGALASRLAAGAPAGLAATKRLQSEAGALPLAKVLEAEAVEQQRRAESTDFAEAVKAFAERRMPVFTGN